MSASDDHRWCTPGPWYAVAGADVTVLLPPTERHRVAGVWELADAGADADELLDAILAPGVRNLDDLALVATSGESVRVLVRGAARASVVTPTGEESLSAGRGTIWAERIFHADATVHLQLTPDAAEPSRPLAPGIAGVAALLVGATRPERDEQVREDRDGETAETELAAAEEELPDPSWSDNDGQTVAGGPSEQFTRPEAPGQEQAPDVVSRPVARLVFSTGDELEVDRTVLVGRAPEARRFTSAEQPRLFTVASPNQEISSTHLEVRPGAGADHGSAVVTDLGSTNGTVLVQPGLPPEDLQPGIAVCLVPGAILDLGDGVTITTTKP